MAYTIRNLLQLHSLTRFKLNFQEKLKSPELVQVEMEIVDEYSSAVRIKTFVTQEIAQLVVYYKNIFLLIFSYEKNISVLNSLATINIFRFFFTRRVYKNLLGKNKKFKLLFVPYPYL